VGSCGRDASADDALGVGVARCSRRVVNFPKLEAFYASLRAEHRRYQLSVVAIVIASLSLLLSALVAFGWVG
jgi:hypothetical protein